MKILLKAVEIKTPKWNFILIIEMEESQFSESERCLPEVLKPFSLEPWKPSVRDMLVQHINLKEKTIVNHCLRFAQINSSRNV